MSSSSVDISAHAMLTMRRNGEATHVSSPSDSSSSINYGSTPTVDEFRSTTSTSASDCALLLNLTRSNAAAVANTTSKKSKLLARFRAESMHILDRNCSDSDNASSFKYQRARSHSDGFLSLVEASRHLEDDRHHRVMIGQGRYSQEMEELDEELELALSRIGGGGDRRNDVEEDASMVSESSASAPSPSSKNYSKKQDIVTSTEKKEGWVGAYSPESRKLRIERFLRSRQKRVWTKKVKYDVRKNFADSRLRVKGRFVKKEDEMLMRDLMSIT